LIVDLAPTGQLSLRNLVAHAQAIYVLLRDESGQDVVEYGILIATIAIVVLLAIGAFGQQIEAWFGSLSRHITTTGT
jgi:Flp pilus assembly pilin Flp